MPRQRNHHQAEKDRGTGNHLPQRRHRHHVAIADGPQRHDRPPHGIGYGSELVGLHAAFRQVHQRRGDHRRSDQNDHAAEQRAALGIKHVEQRAHRRRIARDLEKAHDPEDQHHAQVGGQHEREPERHHGEEVDHSCGAAGILPSRPDGGEVPARRMLDSHPQPQQIFDREHDQRKQLDGVEPDRVAGRQLRHRFERDRHEIDHDEQNEQAVEEDTGLVADRALLEDLVDAPPEMFRRARLPSQHGLAPRSPSASGRAVDSRALSHHAG